MANEKQSQKPRYVLIVEDNVHHAELLTELLDRHFAPVIIHTVDTFADGMEFLGRTRYDIIFSTAFIGDDSIKDIVLDILELAAGTPVIVITGRGDEALAAKLTRKGIAEYRVKSLETLVKLPRIVKKHLAKSRKTDTGERRIALHREGAVSSSAKQLTREAEHLHARAAKLADTMHSMTSTSVPTISPRDLDLMETSIRRMRDLMRRSTKK